MDGSEFNDLKTLQSHLKYIYENGRVINGLIDCYYGAWVFFPIVLLIHY